MGKKKKEAKNIPDSSHMPDADKKINEKRTGKSK